MHIPNQSISKQTKQNKTKNRKMASQSLGFLSLTILMISGFLVIGDLRVSAQCGTSFQQLYTECAQYVLNTRAPAVPPSQSCCNVIRPVNIPCFCSFVTETVEGIVSMEKLVYVARSCGVTVPPGMICGCMSLQYFFHD